MPDLNVISANLHNSRGAVSHLRRRAVADRNSFDVGAVFEAQKRRRMLAGTPGKHYLTGLPGRPDDMGRSTGLLLPSRKAVRGYSYEQVSGSVKNDALWKVGKERWGHHAVFSALGLEIALIGLHPVAGPNALNGREADHPLVVRYRMAMTWLDAVMTFHEECNRAILLCSDIQMRRGAEQPWAPKRVLDKHRIHTFWEGIDVIGWSPHFTVTSTDANHDVLPDHPLLAATLRRSKN